MKTTHVFASALIASSMTSFFAYPVDAQQPGTAKTAEPQRQEHSRAYLGVSVEAVLPDLFHQLSDLLGKEQGLVVKRVAPGSPAAKAGVRPYDVLVTLDDQRLMAVEQLVKLILADKPGRKAALGIVRDGKNMTVEVTLGEASDSRPRLNGAAQGMKTHKTGVRTARTGSAPQAIGTVRAASAKPDWKRFESLNVEKTDNNRFKVTIKHRNTQGQVTQHQYEGTPEDLSRAIQNDQTLPEGQRAQLPFVNFPPLTQEYTGYFVDAGDGQITIQNLSDTVLTFEVSPSATIMLDGKPAKLQDLNANDIATVTTDGAVALRIQAKTQKPYWFPSSS